MKMTWILALVVALISFTVALQNSEIVTVKFLGWQAEGAVAVVMLLMFVAGCVVGSLACLPAILRRNREIHQLRAESKHKTPSTQAQ